MKPPKSEAVLQMRRLFVVGHTIVLVMVILPLWVLAVAVGLGVDMAYFAGYSPLVLLAFVPLALAVPLMHLCSRPSAQLMGGSAMVPVVMLAVASFVYRLRSGDSAAALDSRECLASPEKRTLQEAYLAADELYTLCQGLRAHKKGAQAVELTSIMDCRQYVEVADQWGRHWDYLRALENRFPCAGVCYNSRRLWESAGTQAPPCSFFAAQMLRGAQLLATVVLTAAIVVLLLLIPKHVWMLGPLVFQYVEAEIDAIEAEFRGAETAARSWEEEEEERG